MRPRSSALLLAIAGAAAVAFSWTLVARTLAEATPVTAQPAQAIVWADRVFQDRSSLARWLHSRGASYEFWAARHPRDAAVLEGSRPAVPPRSPSPQLDPGAPSEVAPAAPERGRPVVTRAVGRPGADLARSMVLGVLLLFAAMLAWGAVLPPPFRRRFPSLTERVWPHRGMLAAGATAIVIGLAVGASMS